MIELEFRAMFPKETYDRVKTFLDANATCLGQDDKDCAYFLMSDRLLKIVHNVSKKDAKVSLKLNRLGEGAAFDEMEFHFSEQDFELAKKIFRELGLNAKYMEDTQQRINYLYQDCEIALKYGKTWEYHLEIEKMIADPSLQIQAEQEIQAVAQSLGIKLMTEDEVKNFVAGVEERLAK